jgi:hypothetical protein
LATAHPSPSGTPPANSGEKDGLFQDLGPQLLAGAVLGILTALWAVKVHKVLRQEETILLAMAAADVALLAVILTANALVAGLLQGFFGRVIQTAVGLDVFFRPFKIVSVAATVGALVAFAGAMDAGSGSEGVRATLFGFASGLTTWTIVGTLILIFVFMRYAVRQRKLASADLTDEPQTQGGG